MANDDLYPLAAAKAAALPEAAKRPAEAAPPRKRGRPRGQRRTMILREAARLFFERGFHATSMDEIGDAAGVTGPAVYRHFRSKDELLIALIDEAADRAEANVKEAYETAGTPASRLERLVRRHVRQAVEEAPLYLVFAQQLRNLPTEEAERIVRRERLGREEWVHLAAAVRPDLNDAEVRTMVMGLQHLIFGVVTAQTGLTSEQLEHLTLDIVLAALRTRP